MNTITQALFILLISTLLAACGGGGGGGSDNATPPTPGNNNSATPPPSNQNGGGSTPPKASATLSWNIPSARTNGDPLQLSEINGYEIYYFLEGTPSDQGEVVSINDPSTTNYTTPALDPGTYYFSIVSIDSSGLHSDLADYITITIP